MEASGFSIALSSSSLGSSTIETKEPEYAKYNLRKADEIPTGSQCSFCLDGLVSSAADTVLITKCGHLFCEPCMMPWVKKHRECPLSYCKMTIHDKVINCAIEDDMLDRVPGLLTVILISGLAGAILGVYKGEFLKSTCLAAFSSLTGCAGAYFWRCIDTGHMKEWNSILNKAFASGEQTGVVLGGLLGNVLIWAEFSALETLVSSTSLGLVGGGCACFHTGMNARFYTVHDQD